MRIRKELGLYRRLSLFERAQQEEQPRVIIASKLNDGGIKGYGRRLLYTHFRTMGVNATRYGLWILPSTNTDRVKDAIFAIAKDINPESNQRKTQDLRRNRGSYVVPGPDAIGCLDGHDKLAEWGIEIFGGIDAYS